jgi:hypothetical protein
MVEGGNLLHGGLLCNNVNDILVCRWYKPDVLSIPVVFMFDANKVTRAYD